MEQEIYDKELRNRQKAEAIKRMELLDLYRDVIKEFKADDTLYYSEQTRLGGILYWVSNNPEWEEMIRRFEEKNQALVYHVIHSYSNIGETLLILYVSCNDLEWEDDREMLAKEEYDEEYGFRVMSYVIALDGRGVSEKGSAFVKPAMGGIIRTA